VNDLTRDEQGAHGKDVNDEILQFRVKTEEESYNVEATVLRVGHDWLVSIWGGSRPHIGAVAAAQPRQSLEGTGAISATASVLCLLGHKEDVIVKDISEKLAASLKTNVVVTAGVHWDHIDSEGIQKVLENSRMLITKIEEKIHQCEQEPCQKESL